MKSESIPAVRIDIITLLTTIPVLLGKAGWYVKVSPS